MSVFVDTGVFFAHHDTDAARHEAAVAAFDDLLDGAYGQPYRRCEEKAPSFTAGMNPTNPLRTTFDVPNGCLSRLRSYLTTTEAVYPPH